MLVWGLGRYRHSTQMTDRPEQPDRTGGRPVARHTTAPLSGAAAVASVPKVNLTLLPLLPTPLILPLLPFY